MSQLLLIFKGMAMGMAEVIPGVSGGTIAFITGIYERLLNCIKAFDLQLFKYLIKFQFGKAWHHVDGGFLIFLFGGMIAGLVTGIFTIGILLEKYPAPVWAFFFGLIIVSALYIGQQIKHWNLKSILFLLAGAIFAYAITVLNPGEGSEQLWVVFLSGIVAISALMLPGISGSFILLLLGMYTIIRSNAEMALSSFAFDSILIIVVFLLGCLVGMASFSRLLSFTFKKFPDLTLAVLTGFMIGSLNKIWPWRNVVSILDKETSTQISSKELILEFVHNDQYKIIKELNVWPTEYYMDNPLVLYCVVSAVFSFGLVYFMTRQKK